MEIAAARELAEELGIEAQPEFFYESTIRNDIESENVTVFKLVTEGPFDFSRDEIDEIKFFPLAELTAEKIAAREDFTPNLKVELLQIKDMLTA